MNTEIKSLTNNLSQSTMTTYLNSYKLLRKLLNMTDKRKPIKKMPVTDVINAVETITNPSSRHLAFVVVWKIFSYDSNKELFDKVKEKINKDKRETQVNKNKILNETMPTYKELDNAIKKETDPRTYIISCIMFKLQTRNMDVALIDIHANKKDKYDIQRNHLILDGNKVIYIRNKYKTVSKYGPKQNIIKVKKFIQKVKEFLDGDDMKTLITQKNGKHINSGSTASYLKKYIVLGLNETKIIKIVIKNIEANGDYNMLRKVAFNRGTTLQLLLTEYDISNITEPNNEVITQEQNVKQTVEVE